MIQNPYCDGNRCGAATGEVRLLPYGGGGNLILCRACFEYEMGWRRERNRALSVGCAFEVPHWTECKVYETIARCEACNEVLSR